MLRVHLIRHGETSWNKEKRIQGQCESTLTAEGREQAATLSATLRKYAIDKVYCSSSIRTRETAEILFSDRAIATEYRDDLREMLLGPWEGLLHTDIKVREPERFTNFWQRPHLFALSGAESFLQVQERGVAAFRQIIHNPEHQEIAIVSHGVLIKSILCHVEGRPLERLWEPPVMHNCAHSIVEIFPGVTPTERVVQISQYAGLCNVLTTERVL